MPTVRKLSQDEVRTIETKTKGLRRVIEEEYDTFLQGYSAGDYGEAQLGEDENRITVRNRLKAAATRAGMNLDFKRTKGPTLRFQVTGEASRRASTQQDTEAAESVDSAQESAEDAPAAPKRRGGRPRKKAA